MIEDKQLWYGGDMIIWDVWLGECEVIVEHRVDSVVDGYLKAGWSLFLNRELYDNELDHLTDRYSDLIQEYLMEHYPTLDRD